jgi:hypothetical protein
MSSEVLEKIDFLLRFWELRARSDRVGDPLAMHEQVELLSLMQIVRSGETPQAAGPVARPSGSIPARVVGDGLVQTIEIRRVSAAALLVAGSSALPVGSQVILFVADAVSGIEFALPCAVSWAYAGAPCTMALVVDGIPSRTTFVAPSTTAAALLRPYAEGARRHLLA